jgi:hypothetical protein
MKTLKPGRAGTITNPSVSQVVPRMPKIPIPVFSADQYYAWNRTGVKVKSRG